MSPTTYVAPREVALAAARCASYDRHVRVYRALSAILVGLTSFIVLESAAAACPVRKYEEPGPDRDLLWLLVPLIVAATILIAGAVLRRRPHSVP